MKNNALLSILIPTWNRCDSVKSLIDSSGVIDNPLVEFIIVDNASDSHIFKELSKLISQISNVIIYRNNKNIGMVRNWNKCIKYASGNWLLLMCSDDIFKSGRVIEIIDFIKTKDTEPSLIIQDPSIKIPIEKKAPGPDTVQSINLPIASGNVWHKSITDHLGGFDNRLEYSPDAEFWNRIALHYPVYVLNKHIAVYKRNDDSYMWATWEKEDFIDQIKIIIECNSRYKNPKLSNYDLSKQIDDGVWGTYLEILGNTIITKRQHIFNMYFIKTIKITNSTFRLYELTILLIKKIIVNMFKYNININL